MSSDRVRTFGSGRSASLIATIVKSNIAADAARARFLDGPPGVVTVHATDTGDTVGLELRDETLRVYAAGGVRADVELTGDTDTLLRVLAAPRLLGIPSPVRRAGREAIARILACRVRARGLVRGRRLATRVRGLLTTDP